MKRPNRRIHFLRILLLLLGASLLLVISLSAVLDKKRLFQIPEDIEPVFSKDELSSLDCSLVTEIIDGDTIKVKLKEEIQIIRYLGIDTPEIEHEFTGENQSFGREAKELNEFLVADKNICLQYDIQPKDDYGRLLAYVFLENGIMVNEIILRMGYAELLIIKPNTKYTQRLTTAEQKAVEKKLEIWSR